MTIKTILLAYCLIIISTLCHANNTTTNSSRSECASMYEIFDGDSCENIVLAFQITMDDLVELNPDLDCGNLTIGHMICLPLTNTTGVGNDTTPTAKAGVCAQYYTTTVEDTCELIAQAFQTNTDTLVQLNPGLNCKELKSERVLCVPLVFATTTPAGLCQMFYLVYEGDTCETISEAYKISKIQLRRLNPNLDCRLVPAGQQICVSALADAESKSCDNKYTVYPGDSCSNIAQAFRISLPRLMQLNSDLNCEDLSVGQVVYVPCESGTPEVKLERQPPEYTDSCKSFYTIYDGDQCSYIAAEFQISVEFLLFLNPSLDCDNLPIGLRICIPEIHFNTPYVTAESTVYAYSTTTATATTTSSPLRELQFDRQHDTYSYMPYGTQLLEPTPNNTNNYPQQYNEPQQQENEIELTTTPPQYQNQPNQSQPETIIQYQAPFYPPSQYQPPQLTAVSSSSSSPFDTLKPANVEMSTPSPVVTETSPLYPPYEPLNAPSQEPYYPPASSQSPSYSSPEYNDPSENSQPENATPPSTTTMSFETVPTFPALLACEYLYTINTEDTCESIANAFKITTDTLLELNPGLTCHYLSIGQRICLPNIKPSSNRNNEEASPSFKQQQETTGSSSQSCKSYYTVCEGDTCLSISAAYHITTALLFYLNPNLNCDSLIVGQKVCIPSVSYFMYPVSKCENYFTVYDGDSCEYVAQGFRITIAALIQLNPGLNCEKLPVGTKICVPSADSYPNTPPCENYHLVSPGDTCFKISESNGITIKNLYAINPGLNCYNLEVGRRVCIPPGVYHSATVSYEPAQKLMYKPTVLPYKCTCYYQIVPGDTCEIIAKVYKTTVDELQSLNPGLNCVYVQYGRQICVNSGEYTTYAQCRLNYMLKKGDTCYTLSLKYGIDLNRITTKYDCNNLRSGQNICI